MGTRRTRVVRGKSRFLTFHIAATITAAFVPYDNNYNIAATHVWEAAAAVASPKDERGLIWNLKSDTVNSDTVVDVSFFAIPKPVTYPVIIIISVLPSNTRPRHSARRDDDWHKLL